MPLLATGRLARRFAQAPHPNGLLEPIARWRLAAVGTIEPQPTLQFGNPGRQSRDLRRLRRNQRKQFFPRRFDRRVPIHRILESETAPLVHKNLKATWAVTAEQSQPEKI